MVACHADDISFGSWWSVKRLLKLCNASFSRNLLLRHDLSAVLQRDADTPSLQPALAYDALLGTNLPVEDAGEDRDGLIQTVPAAGPPIHCSFLSVVVEL